MQKGKGSVRENVIFFAHLGQWCWVVRDWALFNPEWIGALSPGLDRLR
jgi:hypothetical protein